MKRFFIVIVTTLLMAGNLVFAQESGRPPEAMPPFIGPCRNDADCPVSHPRCLIRSYTCGTARDDIRDAVSSIRQDLGIIRIEGDTASGTLADIFRDLQILLRDIGDAAGIPR